MEYLIPSGGWVIVGEDFDSIRYDDGVTPVTKTQFDRAFSQVEAATVAKEKADAAAKAALLARLGITEEEARLLLS